MKRNRRWQRRRLPEPHRDHRHVVLRAEEDGLAAERARLASEPAAERAGGAEPDPAHLRELPGEEIGCERRRELVAHEGQAEERPEARDLVSDGVGHDPGRGARGVGVGRCRLAHGRVAAGAGQPDLDPLAALFSRAESGGAAVAVPARASLVQPGLRGYRRPGDGRRGRLAGRLPGAGAGPLGLADRTPDRHRGRRHRRLRRDAVLAMVDPVAGNRPGRLEI